VGVPAVAIAWLDGVDGVTAPILGARTLTELDELLTAAELELSGDERARLERPRRRYTRSACCARCHPYVGRSSIGAPGFEPGTSAGRAGHSTCAGSAETRAGGNRGARI
jgi:hypothetical protein